MNQAHSRKHKSTHLIHFISAPILASILAIILTTILATILTSNTAFAEIAVIVHPENNATLDQATIKRIFMGKVKKFSDGKIALPMNANKKMPSREDFNKQVLGRSSSQVKAYWSKLMFSGKGTMPKELSSDAEIISTVSNNKGAISYVDAAAVTDAVKVVATF